MVEIHGGWQPSPSRAAQLMAEIIKAEMGIDVTPEAIMDFFEKRWRTLSDLAHAIKPMGHLAGQAERAELRSAGQ